MYNFPQHDIIFCHLGIICCAAKYIYFIEELSFENTFIFSVYLSDIELKPSMIFVVSIIFLISLEYFRNASYIVLVILPWVNSLVIYSLPSPSKVHICLPWLFLIVGSVYFLHAFNNLPSLLILYKFQWIPNLMYYLYLSYAIWEYNFCLFSPAKLSNHKNKTPFTPNSL